MMRIQRRRRTGDSPSLQRGVSTSTRTSFELLARLLQVFEFFWIVKPKESLHCVCFDNCLDPDVTQELNQDEKQQQQKQR